MKEIEDLNSDQKVEVLFISGSGSTNPDDQDETTSEEITASDLKKQLEAEIILDEEYKAGGPQNNKTFKAVANWKIKE